MKINLSCNVLSSPVGTGRVRSDSVRSNHIQSSRVGSCRIAYLAFISMDNCSSNKLVLSCYVGSRRVQSSLVALSQVLSRRVKSCHVISRLVAYLAFINMDDCSSNELVLSGPVAFHLVGSCLVQSSRIESRPIMPDRCLTLFQSGCSDNNGQDHDNLSGNTYTPWQPIHAPFVLDLQ